MLNKPEFLKISLNNNLLIPREISIDTALEYLDNKKHIVLKAKDSKTLKKYKKPLIIDNKKMLFNIDFEQNNFIIQEFIDGPSVYYSAYYKDGVKIKSFEQINLVQQPAGGSVLKAAPYEICKDVVKKTDKMFQSLNWSGVMMVEFKIFDEKYYAIECNPRYWGPNQLLIDNGVNFPKLMIGLDADNNEKEIKNIGYKWFNGYILGFMYKISGLGKFQRYKVKFDYKIKYKDLWKRKDTRLYFSLEVMLNIIRKFKRN